MLLEDRKAQLFPTLTPRQRAFAIRFASRAARRFEAGEKVFDVGDRNAGAWLVAEGGIIATRRDGLGREQLFTTCGPGQFSGEISELGGQASLAAARAAPEGCVAYPFDAVHLRALGRGDDLRIWGFPSGSKSNSTLIFGDRRWTVTLFGTISGNGSKDLCPAEPRAGAGLAPTTVGSWTRCCGWRAPAAAGATCPSGSATIIR